MIFQERQYFRQPWIWIPLLILLGIFIWAVVQQLILGEPFGENPAPDLVLLLMGFIPLIIIAVFAFGYLETAIDKEQITIQMFPFHFKPKKIEWREVNKAYVRSYRPILEYGGWGIRYSFKNGRAYNVGGRVGLQLELKSGKKILIGTKKEVEMRNLIPQIPETVLNRVD